MFNRNYCDSGYYDLIYKEEGNMFISSNVKREFDYLFINFINEASGFLYKLTHKLSLHTKDIIDKSLFYNYINEFDIINYKKREVNDMVWNYLADNPKDLEIETQKSTERLTEYVVNFNQYFLYKYYHLLENVEIYSRNDEHEKIFKKLKGSLHEADLAICIDAHDLASKNPDEVVVFITDDNQFHKKSDLILENTCISNIQKISSYEP